MSSPISNPSGGGALQGIGEKFSPDLFTGTGNFSVPIAVPAGRNGFKPELGLQYSTGNGNSPFGLGWNLSIPGVTRKTFKGIPRYDDETDTFILSGAEDLIPIMKFNFRYAAGGDNSVTNNAAGIAPLQGETGLITQYRPRTEGLYARIYHLTSNLRNCWKVMSKNGLTSWYGSISSSAGDLAVLSDPGNREAIFAWKLTYTVDSFGNHIVYTYDKDAVYEDSYHFWDQSYLSQISYGDYLSGSQTQYMFSVVLSYETRPDPFSDYKSGFEVRTVRRCTSIDIYTNPVTGQIHTRSYGFLYSDTQLPAAQQPYNGVSLLCRVMVTGYNGNDTESLPPLDFSYTFFQPLQQKFRQLSGNDMPPSSLANPGFELIDLFGSGLQDIVQVTSGYTRYWRNQGYGTFDIPRMLTNAPVGYNLGDPGVELIDANGDGRLDLMVDTPSIAGYFTNKYGTAWDNKAFVKYSQAPSFDLSDPNVKFVDMNGDGITDAIRSDSGFDIFINAGDEGWTETLRVPLQQIQNFPNVNFSTPGVMWADMTGDGMQDVVWVNGGSITYWPNMGYGKFGKAVNMKNSPRFPFQYDPARIQLGDIDGDGLADLIYVDSNTITFWINQGGNGWSAPFQINGTPQVGNITGIRITDILGNGISGVLYSFDALGNTQRNRWYYLDLTGGVKPYLLSQMNNNMGSLTQVQYLSSTCYYLADQYGMSPFDPNSQRLYANRMPWQTTLPFPVQTVARVEVIDQLSGGKLTTEYIYHHGYWDGGEREYRGFGRVDQRDTETFPTYNNNGLAGNQQFNQVDIAYYSPPTETRNWFHLGPVGDEFGGWMEVDFSDEYWQGDPNVLQRETATNQLIFSISHQAQRDAYRAWRGSSLRSELYALDQQGVNGSYAPGANGVPYTVSESCYGLRLETCPPNMPGTPTPNPGLAPWLTAPALSIPQGTSGYIFFSFATASRTTQWERGNDPMTSFSFTPNYDPYGQPLQKVSAALPRGIMPPYSTGATSVPQAIGGGPILSTASATSYAQVDASAQYMVDRTARSISYEVLQQNNESAFALKQRVFNQSWPVQADQPGLYNIIGCTLNHYDGDAFTGNEVGILGPHGALVMTETLVLTDAVLTNAYGSVPEFFNFTDQDLSAYPSAFVASLQDNHLGYISKNYNADNNYTTGYYAQSGMTQYDFQAGTPNPVGLVTATKDVFNAWSSVTYDPYNLLPVTATQYLYPYGGSGSGLTPPYLQTSAEYDYRVMEAHLVTDPNGNRAIFDFSPLGLLFQSGVIGKDTINLPYTGYTAEGDLISESINNNGQRVIKYQPSVQMQYDFFAFMNTADPVWVETIRAEQHYQQNPNSPTIAKTEYTDGFGRLLQTRAQAEDVIFGNSQFGDSGLPVSQSAANQPAVGLLNTDPLNLNVVVSGWKVYNNKGKVVEQYEPFFDKGFDYIEQSAGSGEKIIMYYDPRGQLVRTINPDNSEQLVVLGVPNTLSGITIDTMGTVNLSTYAPTPWESYTYDANDNAGRTNQATSGAFITQWNTPANGIVDALGRTIQTTSRLDTNILDNLVTMHYTYDIRGNQLTVIDALNRLVFSNNYSLGNKILSTFHIDGGFKFAIADATGKAITASDYKGSAFAFNFIYNPAIGAGAYNSYDAINRPKALWAIDQTTGTAVSGEAIDPTETVTMRQFTYYGDESWIADPLQNNLLSKVYQHFDEAGVSQINTYDFKGNPLQKIRKVISDTTLLTAFSNIGTTGIKCYRADWTGMTPPTLPSSVDPTPYQTDITYDAINRSIQIIYPADYSGNTSLRKVVIPTYNNAGALAQIEMGTVTSLINSPLPELTNGTTYVQQIAYNAKGQKLLVAWDNGIMLRFAYDTQTFRLLRVKAEAYYNNPGNANEYDYFSGTCRYDQAYTYDLVGNVLNVSDQTPDSGLPGNTETLQRLFEYDALYRLIYATGREENATASNVFWGDPPQASVPNANNCRSYTESYSYDKMGNTQSLQHVAIGNNYTRNYNYNIGKNQAANIQDGSGNVLAVFAYDSNGNTLSDSASRNYQFDYANRIRSFYVEASGSVTQYAQYLYDATGVRVKKLSWTGGTNYESVTYIDGGFEYRTLVSSSTEQKNYIQILGGIEIRIGAYSSDDTVTTTYTISDYISSAVIRLLDDGTIYDKEEFYPYGDTSLRTFASKRYRFTGKEKDNESGLYYYRARYYCSWTSKFLSVDPQSANSEYQSSYCYADDNPIRFNDPGGMQSEGDGSGGAGGTGTGGANGNNSGGSGQGGAQTGKRDENGIYTFPDAIITAPKPDSPSNNTTPQLQGLPAPPEEMQKAIQEANKLPKQEFKQYDPGVLQRMRDISKGREDLHDPVGKFIISGVYSILDTGYWIAQTFNPFKQEYKHVGGEPYAKGTKDHDEKIVGVAITLVTWGATRGVPVTSEASSATGATVKTTEAKAVEEIQLKPYEDAGGGHHVPAKSAFRDAPGYDLNKALAIPNEELERLGVSHKLITASQNRAYSALANSGGRITWENMAAIETQALIDGGMAPEMAKETVNRAIIALKNAGVTAPTRIPWGGR